MSEMKQIITSPFLDTREAAAYLKYRSASGIRNAVARGWLTPSGIGPRRTLLFTREELHRFAAARATRYPRPRNGMPGESEVPDETIGQCDEVSRRASSGREAVPRARVRGGSADGTEKGDRSGDRGGERARGEARSRGAPPQGGAGGRTGDPGARWGIRAIVDEVEGAQARWGNGADIRRRAGAAHPARGSETSSTTQ